MEFFSFEKRHSKQHRLYFYLCDHLKRPFFKIKNENARKRYFSEEKKTAVNVCRFNDLFILSPPNPSHNIDLHKPNQKPKPSTGEPARTINRPLNH